jgi:molybdopterin synthase catalytic subunit
MSVRVQEAPFDVGVELAKLCADRTDIGGIGCFIGNVRDQSGGRTITEMTLEHYPAMTQPALEAIMREAEARWPLLGCSLIHRVGRLLPGEGIVLVLAASAHRQAALEATQFLIDYLKTRAPFWKKERFADGGEDWVTARSSDDEAAGRWSSRAIG